MRRGSVRGGGGGDEEGKCERWGAGMRRVSSVRGGGE